MSDTKPLLDTSYHGFLIMVRPSDGAMWIERAGLRIRWVLSRHDGLEAIDSLTNRAHMTRTLKGA